MVMHTAANMRDLTEMLQFLTEKLEDTENMLKKTKTLAAVACSVREWLGELDYNCVSHLATVDTMLVIITYL